jgi:predicted dehydrogenase
MPPPSIGIVGLGYWGPNLLRNFCALEGECTVKYGCDLRKETLKKMRKRYPAVTYTQDVNDLLKDKNLTAIVIATPTDTHYDLAKAALEHGKHVLLEKPMTSTSAQAEELASLARKNGLSLLVDHTFVFAAAVQKILELVQRREIGDLLYFDSNRCNLGLIQRDINVLWDLAIHDLSILSTIVDLSSVSTVAAYGTKHHTEQEEDAHLHLTFPDGFAAHIHVSWLFPVKLRQTIIGGTEKMILYNDIEPNEKVRIYDKGVRFEELLESNKPDPFFPVYRSGDIVIPKLENLEAMHVEVKHFLACVRGEEEPIVSGEDGLQVVRILEMANLSLQKHNAITRPRIVPIGKAQKKYPSSFSHT